MIRLITIGDFIDLHYKAKQRGMDFILSKFTFNGITRTKSAFNKTAVQTSNWWIIPKVQQRWNRFISGDPDTTYKQYIMREFFKESHHLRLLSLGSGTCSHELELAEYPNFKEIVCVDLVKERLAEAQVKAREKKLTNLKFICSNIHEVGIAENYFDIVLFNSSLHHFANVERLLEEQVKKWLKNSGVVIINEYVGPNRLQLPRHQIKAINEALKLIPDEYKKRFKTNSLKKKFYGSGLIRMIIADPSECIDSANILPALHAKFRTVVEKPYGGNILMHVLKDISHHFI